MARSFSTIKLISTLVENNFSLAINRRGFAAVATQVGGAGSSVARAGSTRIVKQEEKENSSSWVPDPVTGYYRPENRGDEIDVAELREMLINRKN
ncbi:hypothetical protein IFM89_010256 [Coptis chinensis]|uniref:Late embryogenesis abundant protein n=1 Tax=Coptis chinensis TaxID=261450 RepID=A0A835HSX1_9MAGN|nr:hypothetical protein IFM89_010256 [Coptis chinensis]